MEFNGLLMKNNICERSVDRFIFRRDKVHDLREMFSDPRGGRDDTVDLWSVKQLKRRQYLETLDELKIDLLKTPKSVLESGRTPAWPCKPRAVRHLSQDDDIITIHSYKDISYYFPDVLDWSSKDVLVMALNKNYYTWSLQSPDRIEQSCTYRSINCCKFDPQGDMLALATSCSIIELHDLHNGFKRDTYCCRYSCPALLSAGDCEVTALDWSPTGAAFATGCFHGIVTSFTRYGTRQHFAQVMDNRISIIRISPDARFLALASIHNKRIHILTWPELNKYAVINLNRCIKQTLAWHPWRTALLAIGEENQNFTEVKIILYDAHTATMKELFVGPKTGFIWIDTMLFSPVTGELVLGVLRAERREEKKTKGQCQLVVMSDHDIVTDISSDVRRRDCFRTMVFSPDGTKLATATKFEDILIWKFLPEAKNKTRKDRRFSAWAVCLDEAQPSQVKR